MRSSKLAALALTAVVLTSAVTPASAFAVPAASTRPTPFRPNVAVSLVFAGTISVILDAMYIAATQCREMTAAEAGTATFLPVVGGIYNSTLPSMSKCKK